MMGTPVMLQQDSSEMTVPSRFSLPLRAKKSVSSECNLANERDLSESRLFSIVTSHSENFVVALCTYVENDLHELSFSVNVDGVTLKTSFLDCNLVREISRFQFNISASK